MKRIFVFTLLFQLMLLTAQAQGRVTPKCKTCGKPIASCKFKGRHPKPNTPNNSSANKSKPASAKVSEPTGYDNGHGYVDLGLSVKWATCNVGANFPEEHGCCYAWGETNTKSDFTWSSCFDCLYGSGVEVHDSDSWSVYKIGGKTKIEPNSGHDTARQNWGGSWRMPTIKELEELNSKCIWKWTSKGGHNGYVVTGPNGNSIFLPTHDLGCYWSSTLSSSYSNYAQFLFFNSSCHYTNDNGRRGGQSVRPVTE